MKKTRNQEQEEAALVAKKQRKAALKANLNVLKRRKPEVLALLGEMSVCYLGNHEIQYSSFQIDGIKANLDLIRQIILNA